MPVLLDATRQVERLREIAAQAGQDTNYAVQIMPPPSYLHALLYDGRPEQDSGLSTDVVLVYRADFKTSTSSLPLDVREELNASVDSSCELGGDPLPAPFGDDEIEVSVSEEKQYHWSKAELNHNPLKLHDALYILNNERTEENSDELDVWCLVDGGCKKEVEGATPKSQNSSLNADESIYDETMATTNFKNLNMNEKLRILVGLHATGTWWTQSFVETQGMCLSASPEMDPQTMKKSHLEITKMHAHHKMNVTVLCRYNIVGQRFISDVPHSCDNASSVSLELMWKQPSVMVPQDATARLLVQSGVGHPSSAAHNIWKQLCTLHKLFELLLVCWNDRTVPEKLPHLEPLFNNAMDGDVPQEPLESRLRTLILGGKQALQAQTASRMSLAPALLKRESMAPGRLSVAPGRLSMAPGVRGRQSMAPGYLNRMSMAPQVKQETEATDDNEQKKFSLIDALELATAGNREDSDVTDGLFSLLIECKTYRELLNAWDLTFMELSDAHGPYVRPKNCTRAAKLIQSFVSDQCAPNFMEMEGNLFSLELLIELGLEKLTTDYHYIFLKSQLVGRDELQAPQLVKATLGVPKDKWLASCGQLLGWLAQVHSALEIVLPLENLMSGFRFGPHMASRALKHYQSEASPVRSVGGLLSPGNSLQELGLNVAVDSVKDYIDKDFDLWKMTIISENAMKKVRSIFLRTLRSMFPPQLYEHSGTLTEGAVYYECVEAVTISQKF